MSPGDQRNLTVRRTPTRVRFTIGPMDAVRFVIDTPSSNPTAWLVTPSGDVLRADSKGLIYSSVEREQVFWLRHPEVGRWSVILRSSAGPQPVTVSAQPDDIAVDPIAVLQLHDQGGGTFSFTSDGSHDPDGVITGYEWSFGDHQYGAGPTASHTYAAPGSYVVALIVTDETGRKGFAFSNVNLAP
jgi:PKD repeat protein